MKTISLDDYSATVTVLALREFELSQWEKAARELKARNFAESRTANTRASVADKVANSILAATT